MGKGSKRRPEQISKELSDLRWRLAFSKLNEGEKIELKQLIKELKGESNVLYNDRT